jgi:hypothetical protein
MLFGWFRTFKNRFNSYKDQFFEFRFTVPINAFARILFKAKHLWIIWMATIFLPCSINIGLSLGGEVAPIDFEGFHVPCDVSGIQNIVKFVGGREFGDPDMVFQKNDFWEEGIAEFSHSPVIFLQLGKCEGCLNGSSGNEVRDNTTEDATKDSTNNSSQNRDGDVHGYSLWVMLLACVVAVVGSFYGTWFVEWLLWRIFPLKDT